MRARYKAIAILLWFLMGSIAIHCAAVRYADRAMVRLALDPLPELYANDHNFQYLAYWFTYGLIWLGLLLVISPIVYHLLGKRRGCRAEQV